MELLFTAWVEFTYETLQSGDVYLRPSSEFGELTGYRARIEPV